MGLRNLARIVGLFGLFGFVYGGARALVDTFTQRFVREFQAGLESGLGERLSALAQRISIESLGFASIGLVLGTLAVLFARPADEDDEVPPTPTRGARSAAWLAVGIAAFTTWATFGAWLANEALPFLEPWPLVGINLAGFAGCYLAFALFTALAARLPGAPRDEPGARAVGACTAAGLAAWAAWNAPHAFGWGMKSVPTLAVGALVAVAALPLAVLLGRLAVRPARALADRITARGRLVPLPLAVGVGVVVVAATAWTAPSFTLSPLPRDVRYAKLPSRGKLETPNVVFVTIDTLRADHLGCYGYERPTSPFLDALAAKGTIFEDAVAAAAWTKPATGTILTGLYPSRHGALYHGSSLQLPEGHKTLAESFRDSDYVTAGFVTNPNLKKVFAFDRGFDFYFDSPVEDTVTLASIRASSFGRALMKILRHQFNWKYENDVFQMNRHILTWLEANRENPFFLYLHYIDPHIPYAPPKEYRDRFARDLRGLPLFNERKEKVGIDLYDAEIRYSDDGMKELVEGLEALGLDDTIFVLTSDHGEEFFEHGVLGHGFSLYQEVVHVPLIVRGPGVARGRRVAKPVQILDLAATVLELAGTGITRLGDGTSFANAMRDPRWKAELPYFLENEFGPEHTQNRSFVFNGVRKGDWKLVLTEENVYFPPDDPRYGREALYNLADDPAERDNLIHDVQHAALVRELLDKLRQHSEFVTTTGFRDIAPASLSADVEKSLKALGY